MGKKMAQMRILTFVPLSERFDIDTEPVYRKIRENWAI